MAALVTIEEVNIALALSLERSGSPEEFTDERVPHIELLIEAASAAVLTYLKTDLDGSPPEEQPDQVRLATIFLVGWYLRNRDGDPDNDIERGYLPDPVVSLLYPLRDPAVA